MRVGVTIAALLILSLAGGAMASDYMLPLLEKRAASAPASEPAEPPQASATGFTPAPNQGIAAGVAAVAALAVVAIALLAYRRTA